MKHLRRFDESYTQQDLDELKDFCDEHLSYLIDEDVSTFYIRVKKKD